MRCAGTAARARLSKLGNAAWRTTNGGWSSGSCGGTRPRSTSSCRRNQGPVYPAARAHARRRAPRPRTSRRRSSSACSSRSRAFAATARSRPGSTESPRTTARTASSTWRGARATTKRRSTSATRDARSRRGRRAPHAPDQQVEGQEAETMLQHALASLETEQRLLLALRDVENMSYEEIRQITGLPIGTVKSKLHRARMALHERFVALQTRVTHERGRSTRAVQRRARRRARSADAASAFEAALADDPRSRASTARSCATVDARAQSKADDRRAAPDLLAARAAPLARAQPRTLLRRPLRRAARFGAAPAAAARDRDVDADRARLGGAARVRRGRVAACCGLMCAAVLAARA